MTTTTMTKEPTTKAKAPAETMKHPPFTDQEWEREEARHGKLIERMGRVCRRRTLDTQEHGMRFAIDVLKILEAAGGDDRMSAMKSYQEKSSDPVRYYRRAPQSRLLWMALYTFSMMHRPAQVGFAIILTDWIGGVMNGCVLKPSAYEKEHAPESWKKLELWQMNKHDHPVL